MFDSVDQAVFTWFCNARSRNVPVNGPIIQEKALQLARTIDPETKFKASNGWLQKFVRRHDLIFKNLTGEGASVDDVQAGAWKDGLQELCEGYEPKDIFNLDETGLFFRQAPRKSYVQRGGQCLGTSKAKNRISVCLLCNSIGEKEKPIVIGNAKRPRCFGRANVEKDFNLIWRHNKNAWMTSVIFEEVLQTFNRKMRVQKRNVLLFLDNASCHPHLILSNVKLVFMPPNTTSVCQPLDQGIIQSFKLKYRKLMMPRIVSILDAGVDVLATDQEITKTINVFDALGWVNEAWKNVAAETIQKCFSNCNFPVVAPSNTEEEPFDIAGIPLVGDAIAFVSFDNDIRKNFYIFSFLSVYHKA